MNRTRALALVLALTLASPLLAQEGTLVAGGTGVVELSADRATLTVAVETRGATADAAGAANAEVAAAVRSALSGAGIAETAVSSAHYNLHANWRRQDGERVPDGYVAALTLRVEVDDIAAVGKTIDAALAGGANRVDGISFGSSQAEAARHEAIARAVQDAMSAAQAMATAAGGELGALVELTSEGSPRPVPMAEMRGAVAMAADMPTEITPGTLTVTARVSGRWRFESR